MGWFRNNTVIRWLWILSFLYHVFGCAPLQIKEGVFSPSHKEYTINIPEKGWDQIKVGKEDIALWHKQYHAMIAFISSDVENKKFSPETLNSQLFIGIKGKDIVSKEAAFVANQRAMHTILECEMDNCKLKIDSYVVKVRNRVYDLVYWAPSDSFDQVRGDFENIVRSCKFSEL